MKYKYLFIFVFLIFLFGIAIKIMPKTPGKEYFFAWDYLWHTKNFRDVGSSINACLAKNMFNENLVLRANRYFSGWPCKEVGNPSKILSLNFDPAKPEIYYCVNEDQKIVAGQHFNTEIISDIEFETSWQNPNQRQANCDSLKYAIEQITTDNKLLIHCNAGRDRTGAVSALLIAITAEEQGLLTDNMLDAIECDYQKTKSLVEEKKGRMKNFLKDLQSKGGVRKYLQDKCGFSSTDFTKLKTKFIQ